MGTTISSNGNASIRTLPEDVLHRQPSKGKEVSPEMPMNREFQKKVKDAEVEIGKLWVPPHHRFDIIQRCANSSG